MAVLLILLCVTLVVGLLIIAGRAFSQSEAASLLGESFLRAAGGPKSRPNRPGRRLAN